MSDQYAEATRLRIERDRVVALNARLQEELTSSEDVTILQGRRLEKLNATNQRLTVALRNVMGLRECTAVRPCVPCDENWESARALLAEIGEGE